MADDPKRRKGPRKTAKKGEGRGRIRPPDDAGPAGPVTEEAVEEAAAEAELREELDRLQAELEALNDRHLRLAAEFDNYRKRIEREQALAWVRAQGDLIRRLLDALDDLDRVAGLERETATVDGLLEGVELVRRKLLKTLEEVGLEAIDPRGEPFDPATMEALMTVPGDEEEDDRVDQVFQKGYFFKGHLLRPARVVVRKHE